jgi:lycopene beta-cyclase
MQSFNTAIDADVLIVGAGPAGIAIAAALGQRGVRVLGIAPQNPDTPWPNTYGIWEDELHPLGLTEMLGHRWANCVSYAAGREVRHERVYGLFDNARLQAHLLAQCAAGGVRWQRGIAVRAEVSEDHTAVYLDNGEIVRGCLLIDATGHQSALLKRPDQPANGLAYQAAYGVVGRFSRPPVEPGQMVLMDYRTNHLDSAEMAQPPTFLYAMDLGNDRYFVEETSLAYAPAVPFDRLEDRLLRRLASRDIAIEQEEHIEHCLFPMNAPLPYLDQPMMGYGGAAGMVHPASGYQVGAALTNADRVADALATALHAPNASPATVARAGWQTLWPPDRLRKRTLYLFGLENLMRFDTQLLQTFFASFFDLPTKSWGGYMSNTLSSAELVRAMLVMFGRAPNEVRFALASGMLKQPSYLWRALRAQPI